MRFAIALALLTVSCSGGGGSSTTPPPTTSAPSPAVAACSVPFETAALSEGGASVPKSDVVDDRRTQRGRVYEQLWKHQAAAARRAAEGRAQPSTFGPTATTEDIGQIAVMRDEGDLVLPPNAFYLLSAAFLFARNGLGGYYVRPSTRAFLSSVGDKVSWATMPARGLRCRSPFRTTGQIQRSLSQFRRQRHLRLRGSRQCRSERRPVLDRTAAGRADLRRPRSVEGGRGLSKDRR